MTTPGAARTLRVALDRWPDGDPERLAVIDRLARCAELCSEHAAAIELLRPLADAYGTSGDLMSRAAVQRRLATAHELCGDWAAALARARGGRCRFWQAGQLGEAAADRLAVAAHLRGAARYSPALTVLDLVLADARASGRTDLTLRAEGLRGNVLSPARAGRARAFPPSGPHSTPPWRCGSLRWPPNSSSGSPTALSTAVTTTAPRRRTVPPTCTATRTARTRPASCAGRAPPRCCSAGASGPSPLTCARTFLQSQGTAVHPRAVSGCLLGLIHALRGAAADARPMLISASRLVRWDRANGGGAAVWLGACRA